MAEVSDIESKVAAALRNQSAPIAEVLAISQGLAPNRPFVLKDTWLTLSQDDNLGYERRLEAYRFLVERGMLYPINLDSLIVQVIAPLGLGHEDFVDVTIEQNVPIQRSPADLVLMIPLPITTPIGLARLFVVVDRANNQVLRATVYPSAEGAEAR